MLIRLGFLLKRLLRLQWLRDTHGINCRGKPAGPSGACPYPSTSKLQWEADSGGPTGRLWPQNHLSLPFETGSLVTQAGLDLPPQEHLELLVLLPPLSVGIVGVCQLAYSLCWLSRDSTTCPRPQPLFSSSLPFSFYSPASPFFEKRFCCVEDLAVWEPGWPRTHRELPYLPTPE